MLKRLIERWRVAPPSQNITTHPTIDKPVDVPTFCRKCGDKTNRFVFNERVSYDGDTGAKTTVYDEGWGCYQGYARAKWGNYSTDGHDGRVTGTDLVAK